MRISDWSSDVCSSDLKQARADHPRRPEMRLVRQNETQRPDDMRRRAQQNLAFPQRLAHEAELVVLEIAQTAMDELRTRRRRRRAEIGQATGTERVCQYVSISEVSVSFKKKTQ